MKSLTIIPLAVAAVLGIAAVVLSLAGISVKPAEPIIAGAIASAAGVAGLLPVLRSRRRDAVSIVQSALAGTMLHLLTQIALAVGFLASHAVDRHGAFPLWLLGGYWTSLSALVWQLRRIILANASAQIPE
jgi:hypothetical protein